MIKRLLVIMFITLFTTNSFSAGSDSSSSSKVKSNYDKAVEAIKFAKKYEEKGKLEKAKKRYAKAQKLLLKSNKEKPNKADTLNYLGFTTRKLGDYENGEKYYLLGLDIKPDHIGIIEYILYNYSSLIWLIAQLLYLFSISQFFYDAQKLTLLEPHVFFPYYPPRLLV